VKLCVRIGFNRPGEPRSPPLLRRRSSTQFQGASVALVCDRLDLSTTFKKLRSWITDSAKMKTSVAAALALCCSAETSFVMEPPVIRAAAIDVQSRIFNGSTAVWFDLICVICFAVGAYAFQASQAQKSSIVDSGFSAAPAKKLKESTDCESEASPAAQSEPVKVAKRMATTSDEDTGGASTKGLTPPWANSSKPKAVTDSTAKKTRTRSAKPGRGPSEQHRRWNQRIVEATRSEEILEIVEEADTQLNAVNLATAVHRIAKWSKKGPSSSRSNIAWRQLLGLIRVNADSFSAQGFANVFWALGTVHVDCAMEDQLLDSLATGMMRIMDQFNPQALTTVAWGMATMEYNNSVLGQAIKEACFKQLESFNQQDLANAAWALTSLGVSDDALLDRIADISALLIPSFKPQETANLMWAFAVAKRAHKELMDAVVAQVAESPDSLSSQALSNIAWSFAKLGKHDKELCKNIAAGASGRMRWFSPPELSKLLWAFATMEYRDDALMESAVMAAGKLADQFTPQLLSNTVWAMGTLKYSNSAVLDKLARAASTRKDSFAPQAAANLLWGYAVLGHRSNSLFKKFADTITPRLGEFTPTTLVTTVWAFAVAGVPIASLHAAFESRIIAKAKQFTVLEKDALIRALKKLDYVKPAILKALSD